MFNYVLKKIVGTKNQRELRRMQPLVARINEREAWAKGLSDEAQTSTRPACPEATMVRPAGERVTAWRAPSGPAPSRAPPAALV